MTEKNFNSCYKKYEISIKKYKKDEPTIIIYIKNIDKNANFSLDYKLNFINDKLKQIIHFKTLDEFFDLLKDNIKENQLIIDPPYKKVIETTWKLFPKKKDKKENFTLILRQDSTNLSLFFFCNKKKASDIIKEIENQDSYSDKKENQNKIFDEIIYQKSFILNNIIYFNDNEKNISFEEKQNLLYEKIESKKEKNEFGQVLILFYDENDLKNIIIKIAKKYYDQHLFFIIINSKEKGNKSSQDLRAELKYDIEKFSKTKRTYFDIRNIIIVNGNEYEKIYIYLLKMYAFFNQLGDGFFTELLEYSEMTKIKGLENEFNYLFNSHNFNILLWGETGVGKSSFINAMMGEKRVFTKNAESMATYTENYYIHKKYPIKIIDVCGLSQGNEDVKLKNKLDNLYKNKDKNILLDMNDIFSFSGDKRNYIHLLLYFVIEDGKKDKKPLLEKVIDQANSKDIPIILVINKCHNEIFENPDDMEDLIVETENANKKKFYKEIVCINCITKNGFDYLFKVIYNIFKKKLTLEADLDKIKSSSITKEILDEIVKKSLFFDNKGVNENLLDEALKKSAQDIKIAIVQHYGHYHHKLKFWKNFAFKIYNHRSYNYLFRNKHNFFPMLTKLVKKLYKNFDMSENENEKDYNNYIKKTIFQYFDLPLESENQTQNISTDVKSNNSENSNTNTNNESKPSIDNNECSTNNNSNNSIEEEKALTDNKDDDININLSISNIKNEKFTLNKFLKDYSSLGKLFWDSNLNYNLKEIIEDDLLYLDRNERDNIKDSVFTEDENNFIKDENKIDMIINYVKKVFGCGNTQEEFSPEIKMKMKIFFILYISNEIMDLFCRKIKTKGFKYKSICDFYYNVLKSYNNAINGFKELREEIIKEKKDFKIFCESKKK